MFMDTSTMHQMRKRKRTLQICRERYCGFDNRDRRYQSRKSSRTPQKTREMKPAAAPGSNLINQKLIMD